MIRRRIPFGLVKAGQQATDILPPPGQDALKAEAVAGPRDFSRGSGAGGQQTFGINESTF